jgi:hypothetical protein
MSQGGGRVTSAQQESSKMNDKITAVNAAPASTPSKDVPEAPKTEPSSKPEDKKPDAAPAAKS